MPDSPAVCLLLSETRDALKTGHTAYSQKHNPMLYSAKAHRDSPATHRNFRRSCCNLVAVSAHSRTLVPKARTGFRPPFCPS